MKLNDHKHIILPVCYFLNGVTQQIDNLLMFLRSALLHVKPCYIILFLYRKIFVATGNAVVPISSYLI